LAIYIYTITVEMPNKNMGFLCEDLMKLFQQLLVAPAALGLMAPIAATASELNVNGVSEYSNSGEIQSVSQFSDVYPTDWAYQALTNLAERHGCVASAPNGSMTRYEAAALLNKCLGNVAQVNEEERLLVNEFSSELAVIKGRSDKLENDLDGFEAGLFSTTTKFSGETIFLLGGVDQGKGGTNEAVTFNYHTVLGLETSFNGNDLLYHEVEAGNSGTNFTDNVALESAYGDGDTLALSRSYYQFPLGDDWTATIGAKVRQDDMLGVWPSEYPSDTVLDVLTYAGANDAYNLTEGAGAGVTYAKDKLSASLLFVSEDAANSSSSESTAGGMLTSQGKDTVTTQIAWVDDNFTIAAAYTYDDNGNWNNSVDASDYSAFGISGVYQIDTDSQWVPTSISAGMGLKNPDKEDGIDTASNTVEDGNTWSVGFMWNDAFVEGNNLGFGLGTAETHRDDDGYDDPLAYELFYQMSVSDSITVTPALFTVQRDGEQNDDYVGGVVKTTFSF